MNTTLRVNMEIVANGWLSEYALINLGSGCSPTLEVSAQRSDGDRRGAFSQLLVNLGSDQEASWATLEVMQRRVKLLAGSRFFRDTGH